MQRTFGSRIWNESELLFGVCVQFPFLISLLPFSWLILKMRINCVSARFFLLCVRRSIYLDLEETWKQNWRYKKKKRINFVVVECVVHNAQIVASAAITARALSLKSDEFISLEMQLRHNFERLIWGGNSPFEHKPKIETSAADNCSNERVT